ncbi:MAG: hypothetical protein P1P90_05610 [Patescibacteria group bacterium]|nr:hypothetical protein [Patescibacteria group bacterium]
MQKTNRLEGKLHKLGHNGTEILYRASFDISEHVNSREKCTFHLAFSENPIGSMNVTLCQLDRVPNVYHFTRTFSEIITNTSENEYGRDVFSNHFLKLFKKLGLSLEQFQELVRQASHEMDLL